VTGLATFVEEIAAATDEAGRMEDALKLVAAWSDDEGAADGTTGSR